MTVFPGLVVHHLLAYAVETGVLGEVGYVAVHLPVDLYVFHHVLAVSLQATVEVVQVVHPAYPSCRGVEELGGYGLRQRVVALLLVSRHEVVAVFGYHLVEAGYLVGRVLQVGVHGDDHVAAGFLEPAIEGGALAVIAAELYGVYVRVLGRELLYDLPRVVGGAIVDEDNLIAEVVGFHHALYPRVKLWQRLCLVEKWYDYGYVHFSCCFFIGWRLSLPCFFSLSRLWGSS